MDGLNKNEVTALINLLDDPDERIVNKVKDKLLGLGEQALPVLEDAWEMAVNVLVQTRIENVIHDIQFEKTLETLIQWKKKRNDDLMEGALIVARYQYPELNEGRLMEKLRQIHQDVWLEMNENLTAFEKVRVLNHIFFHIHQFTGNTENYTAPQNSYINKVLESKKGNPLSLAIIYICICKRLNLPIYGINLPQHFVMAYVDEFAQPEQSKSGENIVFYINPFSKGAIFSRREIDIFLNQLGIDSQNSFYLPCTNIDIIQRLVRNLITSYTNLDEKDKVSDLKEMLKVLGSKN